ncbi:hypothetical protein [Pseudomonas sp. URMO17WK12:I11]|uniref:hypothetical protein n=1 Tax=Pseudomonas sp. URMO17WK12:I11 TaxID=1283291 RepID=UPI0011A78F64|nr:hypothetical protein [Pseudomonas sp. URMO17WK12:I11]
MTKATSAKPQKKTSTQKVRDDFLQPVKNQLREMCGGICSNPDCKAHTFGPTMEERNGYSNIGVAAHIAAAAPGPGARRYDPKMTTAERSSAENGIWLCQSCSKLIDTDEVRFPSDLLKNWKFLAEKRAMELIGKASIGPDELQQKLFEAVANATKLAYTGTGDIGKTPLCGFVRGYEEYLSQLDPRFVVKITASGNHLAHEISTKPGERVQVQLRFKDEEAAREANQKWKSFLETGEGIKINTGDFEFGGSPLFEMMNEKQREGVLVLEPVKRFLPSTLYLRSPEQDAEFELASFDSTLHAAGGNVYIAGSCLDGLFSFKVTYESESQRIKIDYNFDPQRWLGDTFSNVMHLPRLQKAVSFLTRHEDSRMVIELNSNGQLMQFGENTNHDYSTLYDFFIYTVRLVGKARTVAMAIDGELRIQTLDISAHDERLIRIYSEILDGALIENKAIGHEILRTENLSIPEETVMAMNEGGLASYLRISERCAEEFNLFGNHVSPPVFQSILQGFEAAFFSNLDSPSGRDLTIVIYSIEGTTITHSIEDKQFKVRRA